MTCVVYSKEDYTKYGWRYHILVHTPLMYCTRCTCNFNILLHSWLTPLPIMLTDELTHCFTQQLINPSYAYSYMLIPCLPIDYKAPSFWLISAYYSLLIDLLTDHPPCLLISLLIPYSYMLIPLLTDRLQTPYCSLTNPLQILLLSPLLIWNTVLPSCI